MIYSLRGSLVHKEPFLAVVECAGVGYQCHVTCNTSAELGEVGSQVFIYTYMNYVKEKPELFGFSDRQELHCFKLLISVTGIGAKMALAILSDLDPRQFALAVASGDSKAISKVKGVGAKRAQRIVLELKDKVSKEGITAEDIKSAGNISVPEGDECAEALTALITLGFSQAQAAEAIAQVDQELTADKIIKQALRILSQSKNR